MSGRVELKAADLEQVVGGQFHYNTLTNGDGSEYMTCRVDGDPGAGTYYCTDNAKNKISLYIMQNETCTLDDVINYALANGYFWT